MISIVLGSYNRPNKLKKSIKSILESNNIQNPEIIIMDGGSTDDTLSVISSFNYNNLVLYKEGCLHGVTKAYNKGFKLAKYDLITWTSDDCEYLPDSLYCASNAIKENDIAVSFLMDSMDGKGFINYGENSPICMAPKSLFKKVDYWSQDFITYGSDNDFCIKIHRSGGKIISESNAKVIHSVDLNDNLHKENTKANKDSLRYVKIYSNSWDFIKSKKRIYPEILINSTSIEQLIDKFEDSKLNISFGNYYCTNYYGNKIFLNSMNIFKNEKNQTFDLVI